MIELRSFQLKIVDQVEQEIANGAHRVLLVSPTGSGKTEMAVVIMGRALATHKRCLFLANRREIIDQTSKRLAKHDLPLGKNGIIQAGPNRDLRPLAMIQVASIDTLHSRTKRGALNLPPADYVFFDEAHRVRERTRRHSSTNPPMPFGSD